MNTQPNVRPTTIEDHEQNADVVLSNETTPLLNSASSSRLLDSTSTKPVRAQSHTLMSPHRALMGLLKGMVGPGCLSLPYGWKQAGWQSALILSVVISLANLYCSYQLIRTAQYLCKM